MRKIWCIVNFSDSWMRGFMLSQYESKWSFNTNRWHWLVTIRSWISGRSPKKFLSRWLRKMAKLERWRHPEAVTCFLRNWRYQCFPAVSFCKNLMQVMKFTMQSENFPCFSWRLLFSDCSGNIIGSRMSFDLSVFAQTCFDRIFSGMNRRARGLSYCWKEKTWDS